MRATKQTVWRQQPYPRELRVVEGGYVLETAVPLDADKRAGVVTNRWSVHDVLGAQVDGSTLVLTLAGSMLQRLRTTLNIECDSAAGARRLALRLGARTRAALPAGVSN